MYRQTILTAVFLAAISGAGIAFAASVGTDGGGTTTTATGPAVEEPTGPGSVEFNMTLPDGGILKFGLSAWEIKKMTSYKGAEQSRFLARQLAARITKDRRGVAINNVYIDLKTQFGDSWCGPCRMINGVVSTEVKLQLLGGPQYKDGITALIVAKF